MKQSVVLLKSITQLPKLPKNFKHKVYMILFAEYSRTSIEQCPINRSHSI